MRAPRSGCDGALGPARCKTLAARIQNCIVALATAVRVGEGET